MSAFTWRGVNYRVVDKVITSQPTGVQQEQGWEFPASIRHAAVMDQNIIIVLLEDGVLWQCGGVQKGPLILAATASKIVFGWVLATIKRLGETMYGHLIEDLEREFARKFLTLQETPNQTSQEEKP